MAYYYYDYYFVSSFFFLLLLFLLLIIILTPEYTKKDIIPPLSTNNYKIKTNSNVYIGTYHLDNTDNSSFKDLYIEDGDLGSNDAINFGDNPSGDHTHISFVPPYNEARKRIVGYFQLNIATKKENVLAFRVVDNSFSPNDLLKNYNYGWNSLTTLNYSYGVSPVYQVNIPFDIEGTVTRDHELRVQIASKGGHTVASELELASAYLYYYTT